MIKRGFTLAYKERDELTLEMKSPEALSLFYYIEERLLKYPKDKLNQTEIVNHFGYSKEFISRTITILVKYNAIMEVSTKRYIWNPYVTVGKYLSQREWDTIIREKKFKRRGSDINDDFLKYKEEYALDRVTMEDFLNIRKEREHRIIKA